MASIDYFSMTFVGGQKVDLSEARELFIRLSEEFIQQVNQSTDVTHYLSTSSLTIRNLDLMISFQPECRSVDDSNISCVGMLNSLEKIDCGLIIYGRYYPDHDQMECIHKESYERAIGIVEHQIRTLEE